MYMYNVCIWFSYDGHVLFCVHRVPVIVGVCLQLTNQSTTHRDRWHSGTREREREREGEGEREIIIL